MIEFTSTSDYVTIYGDFTAANFGEHKYKIRLISSDGLVIAYEGIQFSIFVFTKCK